MGRFIINVGFIILCVRDLDWIKDKVGWVLKFIIFYFLIVGIVWFGIGNFFLFWGIFC